ncbi:Raf kinase inhibitor-like protein, YbhB/YbcL family [Aquimarina agarilytica]|uniref:Raf kinase inhibitor-like protein, YbhB/YbcL family n=1 Tax=Aquimarina agarilytica TaxID=1087449 RepID=UPI000288376A|nr:Raf kinase inhibitor-like protein, YbhB/YbcL family [Aquimarina agarilytica]
MYSFRCWGWYSYRKKLPHGAINGYNDARIDGYLGPCPQPNTQHTYMITVYALKQPIEVAIDASAALINFVLNGNSLAKASLIAYANA